MMDASKKFPNVFVSLPTHELSLWIKVMVFQALGYQEKAWKAIHYKKKQKKKWAGLMLIHLIEPKWCPNSKVWSTGKSLSEALIFASTNPQYDSRS